MQVFPQNRVMSSSFESGEKTFFFFLMPLRPLVVESIVTKLLLETKVWDLQPKPPKVRMCINQLFQKAQNRQIDWGAQND